MNFIELIQDKIPRDYFSDGELCNLVHGSSARRFNLVKRAIAKRGLLHLRRGLYCLAPRYLRGPLNLFVLSQRIYGPSIVSLETALSQHGWIPEGVRAVTCATSKRSRNFNTPPGLFTYGRVVCSPFLAGVTLEKTEGDSFFLASPWRAMADYVYLYKKEWKGIKPLVNSLRIEEEMLFESDLSELPTLLESFKSRRVKRFISGVIKELI